MYEITLGIIKPHAYDVKDDIKEYIKENDFRIIKEKNLDISRDLAMRQYEELRGKIYFEDAIEAITGGTSLLLLLYKNDAIEDFKKLVGPTDSESAGADTIRGRFGIDKKFNAIHRSDSPENVDREMRLYLDEKDYADIAYYLHSSTARLTPSHHQNL